MTPAIVAEPSASRTALALRPSRLVGILVIYALVLGVALFGTAGTFDWTEAWVFIGAWAAWAAVIGSYLNRNNPDLLRERLRIAPVQEGQKFWDKVLSVILIVVAIAWLLVPALDRRFGWARVPIGLEVAGFVALVPCFALTFLVMRENTFLSRVVKIDRARGHKVITTGPYGYVRHPLYVAAIVIYLAIPVALGSLVGLIPAVVLVGLIVVRTALEDRTLHAELEGYVEYATRTRYRLIPGVW